jgi:hypothetical protein
MLQTYDCLESALDNVVQAKYANEAGNFGSLSFGLHKGHFWVASVPVLVINSQRKFSVKAESQRFARIENLLGVLHCNGSTNGSG